MRETKAIRDSFNDSIEDSKCMPNNSDSSDRVLVCASHAEMLDKFDEYKIKTKINIHKNTVCYDFIFNMNISPDQNNHA